MRPGPVHGCFHIRLVGDALLQIRGEIEVGGVTGHFPGVVDGGGGVSAEPGRPIGDGVEDAGLVPVLREAV